MDIKRVFAASYQAESGEVFDVEVLSNGEFFDVWSAPVGALPEMFESVLVGQAGSLEEAELLIAESLEVS